MSSGSGLSRGDARHASDLLPRLESISYLDLAGHRRRRRRRHQPPQIDAAEAGKMPGEKRVEPPARFQLADQELQGSNSASGMGWIGSAGSRGRGKETLARVGG